MLPLLTKIIQQLNLQTRTAVLLSSQVSIKNCKATIHVDLSYFSVILSFQCLVECRKNVCEKLGLSLEDVELSMGMSNDFEKAVSAFVC